MKYVLDASVAVRWVIPGPLHNEAVRFRDEFLNGIHELLAPDHFPGETASALTKAERQDALAKGRARIFLAEILRKPPGLHSYFSLLYHASDISSETRSSLYDCLYLALAEREQCELITADNRFFRNVQSRFPFVKSLAFLS
jgi:predicted nucleic acid-binding protein